MTVRLAPSLLSADWSRLGDAVSAAERGADWLHLDLMDGHFVPNLTFGPALVHAVRKLTRLPLDAHLMLEDPLDYLPALREAGVEWISVHTEARGVAGPGWTAPFTARGEAGKRDGGAAAAPSGARPAGGPHPIDLALLGQSLAAIRASGAAAGLALRPDTPVREVEPVLGAVDYLVVMGVYPGFSGQPLRPETLAQVEAARRWREAHRASFLIEVDGGVSLETVEQVASAGADVLVAGHAVYRQPDPVAALAELRRRAEAARA